jgi:hypothetical protein
MVGIRRESTQMSGWTRPQLFLDRVFSLPKIVQYPCSRCQNTRCLEDKAIISIHLCRNGFMPGYEDEIPVSIR